MEHSRFYVVEIYIHMFRILIVVDHLSQTTKKLKLAPFFRQIQKNVHMNMQHYLCNLSIEKKHS